MTVDDEYLDDVVSPLADATGNGVRQESLTPFQASCAMLTEFAKQGTDRNHEDLFNCLVKVGDQLRQMQQDNEAASSMATSEESASALSTTPKRLIHPLALGPATTQTTAVFLAYPYALTCPIQTHASVKQHYESSE